MEKSVRIKRARTDHFLSSHFMDEVEMLCDRISILRDGRFVFTGTVQEAMEQRLLRKV